MNLNKVLILSIVPYSNFYMHKLLKGTTLSSQSFCQFEVYLLYIISPNYLDYHRTSLVHLIMSANNVFYLMDKITTKIGLFPCPNAGYNISK